MNTPKFGEPGYRPKIARPYGVNPSDYETVDSLLPYIRSEWIAQCEAKGWEIELDD